VKVVEDLLPRPVKLVEKDLKALNRIFWIDDKRASVGQLGEALGLNFLPDQIVALFPDDIEKELLAKEKAFRGKDEDKILETRFLIVVQGSGYKVWVTDQRSD
jgi:hypothetical protein